jgi:hypothetical protein
MLEVFVWDEDCVGDDPNPYSFKVPLETPWADINVVVRLLYPTATSVLIETVEEG